VAKLNASRRTSPKTGERKKKENLLVEGNRKNSNLCVGDVLVRTKATPRRKKKKSGDGH